MNIAQSAQADLRIHFVRTARALCVMSNLGDLTSIGAERRREAPSAPAPSWAANVQIESS
jgi:hypothetical protein